MTPETAAQARQLLSYSPDTAGGLMITEYLAFPETATTDDVIVALRRGRRLLADYQVQYVYTVSATGQLTGVLRLRDLLLAPPSAPVTSVMIGRPLAFPVGASVDQLHQQFKDTQLRAIPVVDDQGHLVGVARRADVDAAAGDQANQSFLKVSGIVGGEEIRTMPLRQRSVRRLSWLSVNILLNILSASVIALCQETLAAVPG